ncbi:MotA/TolQ/ExbB proton channel [Plesiocystis pacifica SIR-1]|uniref:MotA/TolQ/ExbB proton channel n=1 Tax=Plesiocystis pacifica SIR-1 TaxID=391625 RepID=A6GFY6_9BACT|nr:MotA/TolQ/ExbB proton channel family protein [Plesiocystis pacifica]EDM75231.1 MotA/TolQ/ExbB proton channel [Plesiocystis pacifica SIR-1]
MALSLLGEVEIVKLLTASKGIVLAVVIVLLALVALCIFVILYKLIQVSQAQSQSVTFLDRFWESKRLDDIYRVAEGLKASPLAAMFRAGYVELSKIKKRSAEGGESMHDRMEDTANIERALQRARVSELTKLETLLPFLATTGAAAPFIGLFGTVWGIMDAFLAIAAAGEAELSEISQPIAEALVTTALALLSAVPAVVAFNYFNRRLKVLSAEMQTFGNDYLNIIRRHFF